MNTWDYIERVRESHDGCSDYRIAQLLEVSKQSVALYRKGGAADDQVAARIAKLLGIDEPLAVIADLRATRAEQEGNQMMANLWRNAEAMALGKAPPVVRKVASPAVRVVPLPMVASTGGRGGAAAPAAHEKRRRAVAGRRGASISDGMSLRVVAEDGIEPPTRGFSRR